MANDNDGGNWPPKNFDMIGSGKKEDIQEILDRGSNGNPGGDKWEEFLKNRDGIEAPQEPVSEKESQDKQEVAQKEDPDKDDIDKDKE